MNTQAPVTVSGFILPDGSVEITQPHGLCPGPVRVTLQQIEKENGAKNGSELPRVPMPLPDPPIFDTAISAPCDLPLQGPVTRIYPKRVEMPLPDPFDDSDIIE